MIPAPVVWMVAGGAAVVGLLVVHDLLVDTAFQRGKQAERAVWIDAQRQANDKAAADRERTRRTANQASAQHEAARAAIAQELQNARHDLDIALQRPISCSDGRTLADVVLPSPVLDGVRRAASGARDGGAADRPATGEPGGAVR